MAKVLNPGIVEFIQELFIANPNISRSEYNRIMVDKCNVGKPSELSTISRQWSQQAAFRNPEKSLHPTRRIIGARRDVPSGVPTAALAEKPKQRGIDVRDDAQLSSRALKREIALAGSAKVDLDGDLSLLPFIAVPVFVEDIGLRPQDDIKPGRGYELRQCCDRLYCRLSVAAPEYSGVYLWLVDDVVRYVGQAINFRKRMKGYADIHWRNTCWVPTDKKRSYGQITNCRVNGNLHDEFVRGGSLSVRFIRAGNINSLENVLRIHFQPDWNVR